MSQATRSRVECRTVQDVPGGWLCTVAVNYGSDHPDAGQTTEHEVRLAWCDHDFWSGGRLAPGDMTESVVRYLVSARTPERLPLRFDAAKARRWSPQIDTDLRTAG